MKTDLAKLIAHREFFMKPLANPTASEVDAAFGLTLPDSLLSITHNKEFISLVDMTVEETLVCMILAVTTKTNTAPMLLTVVTNGDVYKAEELTKGTVSSVIQSIINHSEGTYIALIVAGFYELRERLS